MPFEIVRNDLTRMTVDAIVNTANPRPVIGAGTDHAIHEKAGPKLLEARKQVGAIGCGESAITPAFGLDAKYVIHTVSPIWRGGQHHEEELLRKAYDGALELARTYHCKSIAFPLMAAGSYGFPHDLALSIAVHACNDFLLKHRMHIYLVVFNGKAFHLSKQLVADVKSYIDEHYVAEHRRSEYGSNYGDRIRRRREEELLYCEGICEEATVRPEAPLRQLEDSLNRRLHEQHETFTQSMLRIMQEHDWYDTDVYNRIAMDRKTFNKIKNNPEHHPQRKTALQLAIGLRLNLDLASDFIGKAGYAFSRSSKSDVILTYCIENQIMDTFQIDAILDQFGEPALFGKK